MNRLVNRTAVAGMPNVLRAVRTLLAGCALSTLCYRTPARAQVPPSAPLVTAAPVLGNPGAPPLPVDTTQLAVLRAQLTSEKEHNQAILSTVYWSLGVTGGIFVLLLGFGWFVNFRVYDRDKQLLAEQLQRDMEARLAASAQEFRDRIYAEATQLAGRVDQFRGELYSYMDNALEARARVSDGLLGTLQLRQRETSQELHLLTARFQVTKKHYGNAFTNFIAAAGIAEEREIPSSVNAILAELEEAVDASGDLFGSDVEKISAFLGRVENADSVLIERLRTKLIRAERPLPRRPA